MKKSRRGLWTTIIVLAALIPGLVLGYFVGIQEDFPSRTDNPSSEEESVPAAKDQFIVKYKEGVSQTEQTQIEQKTKAKEKEKIAALGTKVLKTPLGKDSHEMVAEFRQNYADKIEYAELNGIVEPLMAPNDPGYKNQWALPKIEAPAGWDISQGSNSVTIAVLDTGVNVNHEDLKNKIVPGYNVVDNNTDLTDLHGHGTMMMGIAGAQTNNSVGIAGVGIEPKIMMVRICNNAEGWAYWSDMAEAITYAADHNVKIVSISFGGSSPSSTVQNAIDYAYSKGVFIAASAGNSGSSTPSYPAASNHVVAVGATDSADQKASWSNWGSWVDVTSPGVSIYTSNKDGGYSYCSGTSPATPHVAAIGGLLLSINSALSPDQIETYVEKNSDDLGSSGKDDVYGYGRVNLRKALAALAPPPAPVPPPQYGSITGKVTNSEGGAAIVGVKVSALQSGKIIAGASSAADGAYGLINLAAGAYDISVTASGFQSAVQTGITVTAGKTTADVNFSLKPAAEKGSISGKVLDWRNKPAVRARVMLKMISTPRRQNLRGLKIAWTNKQGQFEFRDLPEGTYLLLADYRAQFAVKEIKILNGDNLSVTLKLSRPNYLRWFKSIFSR